jgi:hypothetical protein
MMVETRKADCLQKSAFYFSCKRPTVFVKTTLHWHNFPTAQPYFTFFNASTL